MVVFHTTDGQTDGHLKGLGTLGPVLLTGLSGKECNLAAVLRSGGPCLSVRSISSCLGLWEYPCPLLAAGRCWGGMHCWEGGGSLCGPCWPLPPKTQTKTTRQRTPRPCHDPHTPGTAGAAACTRSVGRSDPVCMPVCRGQKEIVVV